jgi:hypothetical protein
VATGRPLQGILVLIVGLISSLLKDVCTRYYLRIANDQARAVLGVEDVGMLIGSVSSSDFLLAMNCLHCFSNPTIN